MLELLPKFDQSKENAAVSQFVSTGSSPLHELAEAGNAHGSIAQMYNQSSGSQGFALRLAPPSQRVANPNILLSQGSPQTASNLNLRQGHFDLGEKNQTQLASPSSFQLRSSNELSPQDRWDDKFNISERMDMSSSLYVHQSSAAAVPSATMTRNQLQMRPMPNGPVSYPSQATLHGIATRYPPFNLASSQDTSQHLSTKPSSQQYPGLGAVTTSQPPVISNIPQQGGFSARPQILLANTQQHLSSNSVETTSLTQQELNDQDSQKAGYEPSELGTSSINSQGSVFDEDRSRKEGSQKLMSPRMLNASQTGMRSFSDKNALASGSLLAHLHQQDLDRLHQSHNHSPTTSERSHESLGHVSKSSHGSHQNYSLLHQVQAMKNVETEQSRRLPNVQQLTAIAGSISSNPKDDRLDLASYLDSSSGDIKMPSFLTEAREDLRVKALSQPAIQDIPSQGMVAFHPNSFHSQPSGSNVVSDHAENSLANLNTVPSWFKQYGTLRNGQIRSIYEAKLAGTPGVQFSLVKPSQTFDIQSSVEQLNVPDASQSGRVWPSTAAAVVSSEPFSASYVPSSSDVIDPHLAITRTKKRKTMMSKHLPWHKEVTKGSKSFWDIRYFPSCPFVHLCFICVQTLLVIVLHLLFLCIICFYLWSFSAHFSLYVFPPPVLQNKTGHKPQIG